MQGLVKALCRDADTVCRLRTASACRCAWRRLEVVKLPNLVRCHAVYARHSCALPLCALRMLCHLRMSHKLV